MGKLAEFLIQLDPAQLVYYPGERLTGFVVINLKESMEMKCLKVEFSGFAYCQWRENNSTRYDGNEKIIRKEVSLFGVIKSSPQRFSHAAGRHSYPFSFDIPRDLPSSFEHGTNGGENGVAGDTYCYIRYMLKAQIEKPWKFDHKTKHPIVLNECIDTNLSQYRQGPGNELSEKRKNRCICFGKKRKLEIEFAASIDRSCYCPGEPILVNARVLNRNSTQLDALKAEIRQEIKFKAPGRTKTFEKILDDLRGPGVLKGSSLSWQNLPFIIPPTAPTITNSKIISVRYEIVFRVLFPSSKEKAIILPLLVGSVPFKDTYGHFVVHNKILPPADCLKDIKFPTPMPKLFSLAEEELNSSLESTRATSETSFSKREIVYGYCKSTKASEVSVKDESDEYTWGNLCYSPLYTYVKISREIPMEEESRGSLDAKHLVNVTV